MTENGKSCPDCGASMEISSGPGRTMDYRGGRAYKVPDELTYPVCPNCGEWLNCAQIKILSASFECQRAERLACGLDEPPRLTATMCEIINHEETEEVEEAAKEESMEKPGGRTSQDR